jgi:hypothetical protein
MRKILFISFILACFTAACALNTGSSTLSYSVREVPAGVPKRVAVCTFTGSLTTQSEATDRFSRGLVDLQFDVVIPAAEADRTVRGPGEGISETMPESTRKRLQETYGLQGIFLGTLSHERGPFTIDTRLTVKFISLATGQPIWSTNVLGQEVTGLSSGIQKAAILAAQEALAKLEQDLLQPPRKQQ